MSNDTQKVSVNVDNNGKMTPPRLGPMTYKGSSVSTPALDSCNISPQSIELATVLENFQVTLKELYPNDNEVIKCHVLLFWVQRLCYFNLFLCLQKEVNEIKRRLGLMEKLWNENKFPMDVKLKLGEVSKGICN